MLTLGSLTGSLLETAEHLCATASLLDSSQLDHIEGRLGALAQKLEGITEKKKQLQQDEEKDKMVRSFSINLVFQVLSFLFLDIRAI